jgi:hypothetical protein
MDVGNDVVGVRNVVADIGNCYMRIDGKFSLKPGGQQRRRKSDETHIKNVKDPVEVQSPGGNHVFIVLRMEKTRNWVTVALFDDTPLDLRYGPAISTLSISCPIHVPVV